MKTTPKARRLALRKWNYVMLLKKLNERPVLKKEEKVKPSHTTYYAI